MQTVTATYRIVTPMFLGGAEHEAECIRPPSIKGALRFWWRALSWGNFRATAADDEAALKKLHEKEASLFGSATDDRNGGQSSFLLTVRHDKLNVTNKGAIHAYFKPTRQKTDKDGKKKTDENHLAAARYLAYGLMTAFTSTRNTGKIKSSAGQLDRNCINENPTFTVTLTFRDKIDDSILAALKALGLLGGLGSRSRHGMGSIVLEKIICNEKEIWTASPTQDQYMAEIKKLIGTLTGIPQPDYSAFSKESRVDCLLTAKTPYEALDEFGKAMLKYRSWGKYDNVLGERSEKRFEDDHAWYKNDTDPATHKKWRESHPSFHPRRVIFGLPHNYGKYDNQKVNVEKHERRASPLFFHVHRLSDKEYIGISVLLKSRFLPDGEQINAGGTNVTAKVDDWAVITDFLDGKVGNPPTTTDRFPSKKAVLP